MTRKSQVIRMVGAVPAHDGWVRDWQHRAPYTAVAWSLLYAMLKGYWAVGGRGFPYAPQTASYDLGPLLGQFGQGVAWIRCDDGRDSCGGAGSGDAARDAKQGAPASLDNCRSTARRSGDACLYCGRRDGPEGWQSPNNAARWGRIAVYVSIVAPVFYAFTRYAWG